MLGHGVRVILICLIFQIKGHHLHQLCHHQQIYFLCCGQEKPSYLCTDFWCFVEGSKLSCGNKIPDFSLIYLLELTGQLWQKTHLVWYLGKDVQECLWRVCENNHELFPAVLESLCTGDCFVSTTVQVIVLFQPLWSFLLSSQHCNWLHHGCSLRDQNYQSEGFQAYPYNVQGLQRKLHYP